MEGGDALGLIAEVGIAIVGFAAVIAALRAPGGTLGLYAAFRVAAVLSMSATVVLLALIPFAFHYAGLTNNTIWAVSSSVMAGVVFFVFILAIPFLFIRHAQPAMEDRPAGSRWVKPFAFTYMGAITVLQLANGVSLQMFWPFYAGLLFLTAYSLFQFGWTLLAPARNEIQP